MIYRIFNQRGMLNKKPRLRAMPQMLLMIYIMTYVVDERSIPQYDKPIFLIYVR